MQLGDPAAGRHLGHPAPTASTTPAPSLPIAAGNEGAGFTRRAPPPPPERRGVAVTIRTVAAATTHGRG